MRLLAAQDGPTVPAGESLQALMAGDAMVALMRLTARLRRDCPWDREQTARSIVPHTLEEAYEVAEAAEADDPAKLLDELGDLLFQTSFLALLLSEQGAGDWAGAARAITAKLIRRHPHVFGDVESETPGQVRVNWERIKSEQEGREGIFHDVPSVLPALLYARKVQRRASAVGFDWHAWDGAWGDLQEETRELREALDAAGPHRAEHEPDAHVVHEFGDLLFATVNVPRWPASTRSWPCGRRRCASGSVSSGPSSWRPLTGSSSRRSTWRRRTSGTGGPSGSWRVADDQGLLDTLLEYAIAMLRGRPRHLLRGPELARGDHGGGRRRLPHRSRGAARPAARVAISSATTARKRRPARRRHLPPRRPGHARRDGVPGADRRGLRRHHPRLPGRGAHAPARDLLPRRPPLRRAGDRARRAARGDADDGDLARAADPGAGAGEPRFRTLVEQIPAIPYIVEEGTSWCSWPRA